MRAVPRAFLAPCVAAVLLHLVLVQPNHPDALTWAALRLFPLELPVLLLGLPLLGDGRAARLLRLALAVLLVLLVLSKAADFAMFTAFGRSFNPLGDLPLAGAGVNLLAGAAGGPVAGLAVLGLALALVLLGVALFWAMGVWARLPLFSHRPWLRRGAGALALGTALAGGIETASILQRWEPRFDPPGAAFTARLAVEELRLIRRTVADMAAFRQAAETDPFRGRSGLLDRIDSDVVVIFIESYGRASLENPLYAATTRAVLEQAQTALQAGGLAMRTGYLGSSTRGGQSWLAHATFASGLRTSDQVRYQALLASGRAGLFHIARQSGFTTAAVMPAITMDWPEGARMGFDRILAAADLGYRGPPFNWVTMPDQFTLAAFDRLVRLAPREKRLFAQVVLISSHAPWVPVPRLIPWEEVGDGRVFAAMAAEGDPPNVVWQDRDRVRDQYRQSVAYALQVALDWAARAGRDGQPPLVFLLGDHQAAGFVAQEDRFDVPLHVIGPPDLVAAAADWGFAPGLIPPATQGAIPMEGMRDRILTAYSSARAASAGGVP
ncbi:MAG: hypothetical protein RIR62_3347 [Pseudomonadota bacterium]